MSGGALSASALAGVPGSRGNRSAKPLVAASVPPPVASPYWLSPGPQLARGAAAAPAAPALPQLPRGASASCALRFAAA